MNISLIAIAVLLLCGCGHGRSGSPLIGAVREGRGEAALELIRSGADPNLPGGVNGWTPVMHAIHKGQTEMVRLLLQHGAQPNLRAGRTTPLIMAAGYGYEEMVRILLEHGADPRLRADDGSSALDVAVGGVPDIDRVTVGKCQTATVRELLHAAPEMRLSTNAYGNAARVAAKLGGCSEVLQLVGGAID
jgi:hypothetical protein